MIRSDSPIQSKNEDALGRYSFAESLAKAIIRDKNNKSLSIGIIGKWGSGKTSLINLIESFINESDQKDQTCIIRFNPWFFSNQEQLYKQFFSLLRRELGSLVDEKSNKAIGHYLETLGNITQPLKYIPTIGNTAEAISAGLKAIGGGIKGIEEKDVLEIKEEVNSILKNLGNKIIVIIDDIDRLQNIEIQQIFQLVKSLGDFSNTVYLLSYDEDVIIKSLSVAQYGFGKEYLEKIVQLPFHIPNIKKDEIATYIYSMLLALFTEHFGEKWIKQEKLFLQELFKTGFFDLFSTIREVNRYINGLRLNLNLIETEINLVDFVCTTAIHVFSHKSFEFISESRSQFVESEFDYASNLKERMWGNENQKENYIMPQLIKLFPDNKQEELSKIVKYLFPKVINPSDKLAIKRLENANKHFRACSNEYFPIYFGLSIPQGTFTKDLISQIIAKSSDHNELENAILNLPENQQYRFLEHFRWYLEFIDQKDYFDTIVALFNIGDLIPQYESFGGPDTQMQISILTSILHDKLGTQDQRFQLLKKVFKKVSRSIYPLVHTTIILGQEQGKNDGDRPSTQPENYTVSESQLLELEKIVISKFRQIAKSNNLINHRHFPRILNCWISWGDLSDVKTVTKKIIRTNAGLLKFTQGFLQSSISIRQPGKFFLKNETIEKYTDIDFFKKRLQSFSKSKAFRELDREVKQAVFEYIKSEVITKH